MTETIHRAYRTVPEYLQQATTLVAIWVFRLRSCPEDAMGCPLEWGF